MTLADLPMITGPLAPLRAIRMNSWLSTHGKAALSSNVGSADLPFQRWFKFKEAYSPKLVIEAMQALGRPVATAADPCGGSGTTALTCSLLGIDCQTIEVNPFLADLIRAKTHPYDQTALYADIMRVLNAPPPSPDFGRVDGGPDTLVEPGRNDRWVFDLDIAGRILSFLQVIESAALPEHQPLFKILLGSIIVGVSNVVINGKGRRYRRGKRNEVTVSDVEYRFREACFNAANDIAKFGARREGSVTLLEGDARARVNDIKPVDFAMFSPPYPNSFDYTDIYNLELWMLGYLSTRSDNTNLRNSTIHSHVQIHRNARWPRAFSPTLESAYDALAIKRKDLWNSSIPEMVTSYSADMEDLLGGLAAKVRPGGGIAVVVGASSYAGLRVDVPQIFVELAEELGLIVLAQRSIRAMRMSAQQGGQHGLAEDLLIFRVPE